MNQLKKPGIVAATALVVMLVLLGCGETAVPTPTATSAPPTETPTAAPLPDLTIGYYTVTYDDCPWGGPGTVSVNVANVGAGDAGAFEVTINNGTTNVASLVADGETAAAIPFQSGPIGGINAEADSAQQIAESNETNNSYTIMFTPPPPCPTP